MLKNVYVSGKDNTKGRGIFLFLSIHYLYLQCLNFIVNRVMVKDARSELTFMEIEHCLL